MDLRAKEMEPPPHPAGTENALANVMPAVDSARVPYINYGGAGRTLVFLHANGYPPGCYASMLSKFSQHYRTMAMLLRPLWPRPVEANVRSWSTFSEDLLQFLEAQRETPVFAVGHSLGAVVALRAALRAPARFVGLVLLDPVLSPPRQMLAWWLARSIGIGYRVHPMIRTALSRRRRFDRLDEAFNNYRRRQVFRYLGDDAIRTLVQAMTKAESDGGYRLAYSPEWEARVYYTEIWNDWDLWRGISGLAVPLLIIRGSDSSTFTASTARALQKKNSRVQTVTVDNASHLLPLERPEKVFELAQDFLAKVQDGAA